MLKGVLARAQYLDNGKVVVIPEGELLNHTRELDILPGFNLEGFPNRDSVPYSDLYNIQGAKSIVRGTLRFKVRHCGNWTSSSVVHVPFW